MPRRVLVDNYDLPFGNALMNRSRDSVSLLTWCFNEELLIEKFLHRAIETLDEVVDDFEIVVVDDGSTDSTPRLLAECASKDSRIKIYTNPRNLNVGLSCRAAIKAATKDIIFWQTIDWSYDLKNLSVFLSLLDYYDAVQGFRPTPIRVLSYIPVIKSIYRVRTRSDTMAKAYISLTNYYVLRILFGAPFQDFQNVTFYRTKYVQKLALSGRTPFVNPELLIRAHYDGQRIIEVPIPFIKRSQGEAKGTRLPILFRTVVDILRNWILWGIRMRWRAMRGAIHRVSHPFELEECVLESCLPLFKDLK